jgi:hypothetical protein
MTNPWHKNEVDMIRTNTALHLDLSPQEERNASSFGICRDRNRIRLTTRWSGLGIQRQMQGLIDMGVPRIGFEGAIPSRSARSRYSLHAPAASVVKYSSWT